ncbi:MAG: hypothetical protein AAB628_03315 [Patescibacteria group bacterium]
MNSNAPKVSFIPKNSLTHGDDAFSASRPKSLVATLAIVIFVITVGVYGGLLYYKSLLAEEIQKQTVKIKTAQDIFTKSPDVEKAKVFNTRAELARKLLDSHIVVSPVFDFLSLNTVTAIKYESFAFKREMGIDSLELKGEAPSYASLINQLDIIKKKQIEISGFEIRDISLTKFGTVTFTLKLFFVPGYLSYTNDQRKSNEGVVFDTQTSALVNPVSVTGQQVSQLGTTSPSSAVPVLQTSSTTLDVSVGQSAPNAPLLTTERTPEKTEVTTSAQSELLPSEGGSRSFWSWIKFW